MLNLFTSVPSNIMNTPVSTFSTRAVDDTLDIIKEQITINNCRDAVLGDDTCALLIEAGAYNITY